MAKKKKETRGGWNKKYKTPEEAKAAAERSRSVSRKKNTTCINVRFNNVRDAAILERLASQPNKADYLRRLIQADIDNDK